MLPRHLATLHGTSDPRKNLISIPITPNPDSIAKIAEALGIPELLVLEMYHCIVDMGLHASPSRHLH